jgi:hypothetical protein
MEIEQRTRGSWSTKKKDPAPRGVYRHPSGDWAIRFTCGAGKTLSMVLRYSHLAPSHLQAAVERLVPQGATELARN